MNSSAPQPRRNPRPTSPQPPAGPSPHARAPSPGTGPPGEEEGAATPLLPELRAVVRAAAGVGGAIYRLGETGTELVVGGGRGLPSEIDPDVPPAGGIHIRPCSSSRRRGPSPARRNCPSTCSRPPGRAHSTRQGSPIPGVRSPRSREAHLRCARFSAWCVGSPRLASRFSCSERVGRVWAGGLVPCILDLVSGRVGGWREHLVS